MRRKTKRSTAKAPAISAAQHAPDLSSHVDRVALSQSALSATSASPIPAPSLIALQQTVGNQATQRFFAQRAQAASTEAQHPNRTGMPDKLKTGIESLSGMSMDAVRVHYQSPQPAQISAAAYAQGNDIHVGPGAEQHLPHEAWHVVQQAQGRVPATTQIADSMPVNDHAGLEQEAEVMGAKAQSGDHAGLPAQQLAPGPQSLPNVVQGMFWEKTPQGKYIWHWGPVITGLWVPSGEKDYSETPNGKKYGVWLRKSAIAAKSQPATLESDQQSSAESEESLEEAQENADQANTPEEEQATPEEQQQTPEQSVTPEKVLETPEETQATPEQPVTPAEAQQKPKKAKKRNTKTKSTTELPATTEQAQETAEQPATIKAVEKPIEQASTPESGEKASGQPTVTKAVEQATTNPQDAPKALDNAPAAVEVVPECVELSEQTKGKTLGQLIKLPDGVTAGRILYRGAKGNLNATDVLPVGVHTIQYRYQPGPGQPEGRVHTTVLHIKPTIKAIMTQLGFTNEGWRWELPYGTHGTLNKDFHLSVPKKSQYLPDYLDDLDKLLAGLFPEGEKLGGTHMTVECRVVLQDGEATLNNAAYFLNGNPKYPQGYTKQEQDAFVKACMKKLEEWKKERKTTLREALKAL